MAIGSRSLAAFLTSIENMYGPTLLAKVGSISPNDAGFMAMGPSEADADLSRNFLPENVKTTVTVERGLLLHEFPALLGLVVEQQLKPALSGAIFVRVVSAPELFDAVLPLSAHALKGTAD